MPKVGIIMGSDSDLPVMREAGNMLDKFGIEYDYTICSAHRLPRETADYASNARVRGLEVIIAGAGGAAHLPGVIAAYTNVPVIGVPIKSNSLSGVDSLYSIVQMPKGIPVATVAINGSANAAILAAQIMALKDENIALKLDQYRDGMAQDVMTKNNRLQQLGVDGYLQEKEGNK